MLAFRERLILMLVAGLAVAALPAVLIGTIGMSEVALDGQVHFYAVGLTALAAAAAAIALTVVGARFERHAHGARRHRVRGDGRAARAARSLDARRPLRVNNGVVALTGGATLPVGAAILALSAFSLPRFLRGVKPLLVLEGACCSSVVSGSALLGALRSPSRPAGAGAANSPAARLLLAVGLVLFCVLVVARLPHVPAHAPRSPTSSSPSASSGSPLARRAR